MRGQLDNRRGEFDGQKDIDQVGESQVLRRLVSLREGHGPDVREPELPVLGVGGAEPVVDAASDAGQENHNLNRPGRTENAEETHRNDDDRVYEPDDADNKVEEAR